MRTWAELLKEDLKASAEEATEYLRAILEENDPQLLLHALRRVSEARGSLDDLDLSRTELLAIVRTLSSQSAPLPQAA